MAHRVEMLCKMVINHNSHQVDKMSTSEPVLRMWKADTGVKNVKVSPVHGLKVRVHMPLFLTLALVGELSDSQPSTLHSGQELDNNQLGSRASTHVLEKIKNFLLLSGIYIQKW